MGAAQLLHWARSALLLGLKCKCLLPVAHYCYMDRSVALPQDFINCVLVGCFVGISKRA